MVDSLDDDLATLIMISKNVGWEMRNYIIAIASVGLVVELAAPLAMLNAKQ